MASDLASVRRRHQPPWLRPPSPDHLDGIASCGVAGRRGRAKLNPVLVADVSSTTGVAAPAPDFLGMGTGPAGSAVASASPA